MKRIALYHLETLLSIARLGTFAAAADRLNTTQPAISARMRELEGQLGFAIFRRDGRRMSLTARGRQLVRECEPLWSTIERVLAPGQQTGEPGGVVRISAGEIAAASCLPEFVAGIERDMPGVSFDIEIDLSAHMQQKLIAGTTDIVFLAGPLVTPGIRTAAIGSVKLLWLGSPATAAAIHARGGFDDDTPIWSLPHHSPLHRAIRDTIDRDAIRYRSINTCSNVRLQIEVVAAGSGVGIFPETMVRDLIGTGALIEVLAPPPTDIMFQTAIREEERDPAVLRIFERASLLTIE